MCTGLRYVDGGRQRRTDWNVESALVGLDVWPPTHPLQEHLGVALALNVPIAVCVTKVSRSPHLY